MDYFDPVYGPTKIDEPVLLAVIDSAAMQRLKGVLQHGISGLIGITRATTRYEHSLGTMLLVKRLGGSLNEQIAALLHDVSHTAFSHVIDYVFDGHDSQSYHDEVKEEILGKSDLPNILHHFHYDWRVFLEEEAFSLLEQPAPTLCADRLDYFLRDSLDLGLATKERVAELLGHLAVHEGKILVGDISTAQWLGYTYIAADKASWANFREVGLYELTARAIKKGFEVGAITQDDLWSGDMALWEKLNATENNELNNQLAVIKPETEFIWDEANPDFKITTKIRTIDPEVYMDEGVRRLSDIDQDFAFFRQSYLESSRGKWYFKVIVS